MVIFDQKYKHEGNPFENDNKIFLRTELIYKVEDVEYDPEIAKIFNMACYMTKYSNNLMNKDISKYSSDLFNKCEQIRNQVNVD